MDEMLIAYQNHVVGTHAKVKVRMYGKNDSEGHLVESTVGRFIYNQGIPQDLGFVDRSKDKYRLEVDFICGKKQLGQIIDKCFRAHENTGTVLMLDYIKSMGYKYSTLASVTIGVDDMKIPENKWDVIHEADKKVEEVENAFRVGLVSEEQRHASIENVWNDEETGAKNRIATALMDSLKPTNNLYIMATSGARGSKDQIGQIGGMRGLMGTATGKTVEIPIKANFREGLSILEYFISSNGARKGLADTALRTADSGYLTRRLVDVSHNVIVREYDCGTDEGVEISAMTYGDSEVESLATRVAGRTATEDVCDPETGEVITEKGEEITDKQAKRIEDCGIKSVKIRSVMTCRCKSGVCAKCYGRNLATGEEVNIGEAVGIIAAQSIGEPGTQLTMRTFHSGGVAGSDITTGLPRVVELFEARRPKGIAEICEEDGIIESITTRPDHKTEIVVKGTGAEGERRTYVVPYAAKLSVKVGDQVYAGSNINEGPLNPHDIFRLRGMKGVYDYLLKEVQRVYSSQGVDINDKHIEIIVSQMLSKFSIDNPGDTSLLPGGMYSRFEIEEENEKMIAEGKQPATYERKLLGITKASLATSSFLSAASFQETTRVLTDASIKGKSDRLQGLKENVIIGKLIPAGTGMRRYRNVTVDYGENTELMESYNKKKYRYQDAEPDSQVEEAEALALAEEEAGGRTEASVRELNIGNELDEISDPSAEQMKAEEAAADEAEIVSEVEEQEFDD